MFEPTKRFLIQPNVFPSVSNLIFNLVRIYLFLKKIEQEYDCFFKISSN